MYLVRSSGIASPIAQIGYLRCAFRVGWVQLLLQLNLDCCWQINERGPPRPVCFKEWLWPLTTNLCPLWRVSCAGAGWWCSNVVCSCPLGTQPLGFPWWCRQRSAPTCVLSRAIVPKIQSNLRWLLLVLGFEFLGEAKLWI